jgi:hypothetical protein
MLFSAVKGVPVMFRHIGGRAEDLEVRTLALSAHRNG